MSLLLAVLMVLEVFSPVAVSARALLDEEENHTSIMSEPRVDSKSILGPETKPKKEPLDDELFSVPAKKAEPNKEINKIQEAPARQKDSSILIETPAKEETAPQKEVDKAIIEAGRQREQKAEDKLNQAVERAKQAEQNAKASENLNLETKEIEKPGYKAWRVVNRIKAIYKDGKLDCQGLLIEVEDFKGNKKTLTYDDILKDENIIVNKEIKEGLFGSSELIITTPGLRDIKIDVKVENIKKDKKEKSDLSLEKDNSNKLENDTKEEEKEGLLDKIKNFFADDEQTKGLEEDAGREDAKLEFSDLDGINKVNELTEEELEAGLTLYQMPTVSEKAEEGQGFFSFFRSPVRGPASNGDLNLDGKKFTIITRFDTSNIGGPIQDYQYFKIHLDEKLTVNDPNSLKPIKYNGRVVAIPSYDKTTNIITYNIQGTIPENIQVPLNIPVDYNIDKINELASENKLFNTDDSETFTVTNKVSGLGVKAPKDLVPQKVDKNGNPAGSIIEPGRDDVIQIVDSSKNYRLNMDSVGYPVIENGELVGINWVVKIDSEKDLVNDLGMKMNFTLVEGSGLKNIENINLSDPNATKDKNKGIIGKTGIVDSVHSDIVTPTKSIQYNIYTPVSNKQSAYVLDISTILTKDNNYIGAVRSVMNKGYAKDKIEQSTPTRVGINNTTTIQGKFTSNSSAEWTITDGVCTNDPHNGMPFEDRTIEGNPSNLSGKRIVYGVDKDQNSPTYGQMVVKETEKGGLTSIPAKETDPNTKQAVGSIGVYQFTHDVDQSTTPHSYKISGVKLSKFQDIYVEQIWNLPAGGKMPAQTITVKDIAGNPIGTTTVDEKTPAENEIQRMITVPDVKYWNIDTNGNATMIEHTIDQGLPTDKVTIGDKTYKYYENVSYYKSDLRLHHIQNSAVDETEGRPATFTVIKVDSKDAGKRIPGATFKLIGANENEVITDANGKADFINIAPGTYTLKETKAPAGYKLDQEDKIITVSTNGEISVSGNNADLSQGVGKTETVEHDRYPSWPDYMNAMHYGKVDEGGNVEFYLYLKPIAPRKGGQTDRDTRLGISIPGITITDVKAYNVYPENRQNVKDKMQDQQVDDKFIATLGDSVIGKEVIENGKNLTITGTPDSTDNYTGRKGYITYFPKERFRNDWGFLVKVTANIGTKDSANLYYDWLTSEDTANQTNLQKVVTLSKNTNGADNNPTITIKNESFTKSPIAVTKFADTKDQDGKRNKLIGAEFTLKDANGNVIANKVTTAQSDNPKTNLGEADFGTFPPGTYILEETKAPQGYQKSNVYFEVVVDEKGQVTYNPKFNNGSGTPALGEDYVVEKGEETDTSGKATITHVNQWLDYQENEPGDIGTKTGVWEAYMLESLKYHADITISNVSPGTRFEIQFDPNLDFTQYFSTFPKIKTRDGKEIADPYFNYKTNLLTYVFNDNSKGLATTTATIDLRGIIPSKFYAKDSGIYKFNITVGPGVQGENTIKKEIVADYGRYDTAFGNPAQSNYFRDVYQDDKGNWYVTIMSYYNALGDKNQAPRTLSFNWLSTNYQKNRSIVDWQANGTKPAYELSDVKIYRTDPSIYWEGDKPLNRNMPLSYGIRPERDPYTYYLAYHTSINPNESKSDRSNNFDLQYDKNQIQTSGSIQQKTPLRIKMPGISKQGEGYVIEQTFKIPDINEFNNHWRAAVMSNGNLKSAFANGVNFNKASAEQSGSEIPKYYREVVGLINKKYTPGQFEITKLNEADRSEKLKGATFALTDENGYTIHRSSNDDGIVSFKDLEPGRYTLEEASAPTDYIKSNKKWNVTVYPDGKVKIVEIGILGADGTYQGDNDNVINIEVANKPTNTNFVVYKKGSDGKPLKGAKFVIKKQDGTTVVATGESNEKGVVNFTGTLENNKTYIIEETEAPIGYHKLNKQWVLVIDDKGNKKVYNYRESGGTTTGLNSILEKTDVYWVDVAGRSLDGWNLYDNRFTGWTGNNVNPFKMGTRIVGINTKEKYVIQRYVINPESANIAGTTATIHREKPEDPNMTWYNENAIAGTDYQVFKLNKPVTGIISDIRLAEYGATDITGSVKDSAKAVAGKYGEPKRLSIDLPATDKPLVIDIKVPYKNENGGVGTGMDWTENGTTYWKSDYYEKVSTIKQAAPVVSEEGSIIGSYISENSLDVTNDIKTYKFRLKKVKKDNTSVAIEGAEFKLTGPEPSTDAKTITTGKDGMIAYDNLKPGTYKLEETKAAPGYQKANTTWTVTISQDGKTFIRDDNASASQTDPSYNIGLDTSAGTQSRAPINAQLYNEARVLKTALYGQDTKDKENSLVFKSEADKNEGSIKEKIDAIYGTDNLEELYPNGFAFKEIGMAAYSPELSTELGGLEISEENVPKAQRAGGWEDVDPNKSTIASHQDGDGIQTKITKINKDTKEFTQVFLIDGSKSKQNPIMFNLRGADGSTSSLGSVQVYQVTSGSTIDNIVTSKSIDHNGPYSDGNIGGQNITFTKTNNKYAVEITTSYTENKKLGFEGRFIYDRKGKPNEWKYATAKESYNSANDINKEETTYKVTPNVQDNGTVTADPNQNVKAGDKVTLTLNPKTGYVLKTLEVNGTAGSVQTIKVNENTYTFKMPESDVTVSVYFIKPQAENFSITVNPSQNGYIIANKERAEENEQITLTVNANQNYELESITVTDANGRNVQVTNNKFTMPASNVTVNATFKPIQYNITTRVNDASLGSVTVDKNKAAVGEKVTITVTPKDNTVEITEVKVGGTTIGPQLADGKYTFEMPANHVRVDVTFNKKTYTTYDIGVDRDDGKYRVNILPTESKDGKAKEGEIVKFTAQGVNDYAITEVYALKSDGSGQRVEGLVFDGFNGTFTMPATGVTIYVKTKHSPLAQDTFRATPDFAMVGGNVRVSPSTGKEGTVVRLTINPWEGNTNIKCWVTKASDGGSVPVKSDAEGLYFEMPNSHVTVYATFKQATQGTLPITIDGNIQNGSVSANVAKASEGDKVFLYNRPAPGYELQKYTVTDGNGQSVPVTGNIFTMPATGVTVSATFGQVGTEIPADGFAQIFNTQTGLELKVYKRDFYKRPLAGGEFTLQKATDDKYEKFESTFGLVKATSDKDGKLLFKDASGEVMNLSLQPGYYLLTETQSPSGYKKAQAPWRIRVYEENGQLKAEYQGPEDTPNTFIDSDKAKDKDGITTTQSGIKYAARMTYINPETKTYVQRIYVDTRGYTGKGKVNVQITPKFKREEIDTPGAPPKTTKEGVKTAYRSTYQISGLSGDPSPSELNNILRYYDISYNNVSVVNTARWRPFDWGFDEDQLNLDKGVYYIDVEGFYDDAILTGIDKSQKDASGNPTIRTDITEELQQKLQLNIDFLTERYFYSQAKDKNGNFYWQKDGSYQSGAAALGGVYAEDQIDPQTGTVIHKKGDPTEWGKKMSEDGKYPNWIGKKVKWTNGSIYKTGKIQVPDGIEDKTIQSVQTSIDISSLYKSDKNNPINPEGMNIVNDEETYNITFSKHGRDKSTEDLNGEEVTRRRLAGAVFKLQEIVGNTNVDVPGSTIASAFNGYFGFRGLKPGRYVLLEEKAPEGYKPINGPLLYFTIETIKTNSGKIVDPETGKVVNIKTISVKFPGNDTTYELKDLSMIGKDGKPVLIGPVGSGVDSKEISLEDTLIVNPKDSTKIKLNELSIVGKEFEKDDEGNITENHKLYPFSQIKIIPDSSGYVSLEYDKANGVYQYVPEKSTSEKDGKLVDFVTSGTAKNMGKIVNEKPGNGSVTLNKIDQNGNTIKVGEGLEGATFKLTNINSGAVLTQTVGKNGTLKFEGLNIGQYRLEEVESPNGYINNKQVWNFTVGGKDLDPYAGDPPARKEDLSSKITLSTEKDSNGKDETYMTVQNPKNDNLKEEKAGEVHPHLSEVMEFTNTYKLAPNTKINPGDYFTIELTDNIDLNGIMQGDPGNLDLFADGVGTIAKADYNKEARTITYTFTDYAKTYQLAKISNKLKAYINLEKVPKGGEQNVGLGIIKQDKKTYPVNVVYDSMTVSKDHGGHDLNLGSKIVKYNPETGEFVHYYYINKNQTFSPMCRFYYSADQDIENLQIGYYYLKDQSKSNLEKLMPESFGVNENDSSLSDFTVIRSKSLLQKDDKEVILFEEGLKTNESYIFKVTGKISDDNKLAYVGHGELKISYVGGGYLNVTRFDQVYPFYNDTNAKADLTIQAVNPENRIKFMKTDQDGKPIKGAEFQLQIKDGENWKSYDNQSSGEDGIFEFTQLKPGEYRLVETKAVEGYKKLETPVMEFTVDKLGKIYKKESVENSDGTTSIKETDVDGYTPIPVVNKKEKIIKFKKVDVDGNPLAGAEFEVWYKKDKSLEYNNKDLKLYQNKAGDKLVLNKDEKAPAGYTEVKEFTTGDDGILALKVYDSGYYALKEVKAPKGYIKPREYVKEFSLIDGSLKVDGEEQAGAFVTEVKVDKKYNWVYTWGFAYCYFTDISMKYNVDNTPITYTKDNSKLTLSGLPKESQPTGDKVTDQGISITARLLDKEGKSTGTKTYKLALSEYNNKSYTSKTIDLFALVKELEGKTDDKPITTDKSLVITMNPKLYKSTELDLGSNIVIGDKVKENRTFHIGTKGEENVDHSYSFTTKGEVTADPIDIVNKKGEYPWTGGMGTLIFTVSGLILMTAAAYVYSRKRRASYDD